MKFPCTVSDVMNDLVTIEASTFIAEASKTMIDNNIGSIVVTVDGKPEGIITTSDMLARVIVDYKDPKLHLTKTIMSSPLISVSKDVGILDAMRVMRDKDIKHLLIEDDGKYVGILSERDMIRAVTLSSLTQFSTILKR